VDFGASAASTFSVNSGGTSLTATAPAGTGTVNVTVTTPGGTSATSSGDQFTYTTSSGGGGSTIPSPTAGGWQLNGSATLVTTTNPPNLQLTPATPEKVGSAFWPTAVPSAGIIAAFDISIGSGSGADGETFTLADASVTTPSALGVVGGGLGYSGITGIAVSFDTYKNAVNPSNNFVGIATGPGSSSDTLHYVATNTAIPALRNTVHHIVVTTTASGITVSMDGTVVLTYATALPPSVLVGFTGATGGYDDIHAVQNVVITTGSSAPAARSSAPGRERPSPPASPAPAKSTAPRASAPPKPPPPPPPVLSESPGTVSMAESNTNIWTGSFTVTAANGPISFSVSAPSGVTVSEAGGTVSPGSPVTIRVTYILQLEAAFPAGLTVNGMTVGLSFQK